MAPRPRATGLPADFGTMSSLEARPYHARKQRSREKHRRRRPLRAETLTSSTARRRTAAVSTSPYRTLPLSTAGLKGGETAEMPARAGALTSFCRWSNRLR